VLKIVLSDSGVVSLQESIHRNISLEEYLLPDYPHVLTEAIHDAGFRAAIDTIAQRPLTNYGDSSTASQIALLARPHNLPVILRHPRQISRHDFDTDSFVLLGGRLADPWYRLFEPRLNFVFDSDPGSGAFFVRNTNARAGEAKEYHKTSNRDGEETFAVLSLLPNLRSTGYVLLLAGINLQGTEGAVDVVMREELPKTLFPLWREVGRQGAYFEALLKVRSIGGIPRETSVVSSRIIPAPVKVERTRPADIPE
jgi:hypothetical protein